EDAAIGVDDDTGRGADIVPLVAEPDGDVAGEILVALVVAVEQRVAAGGKIEMSGLVRQERHVAQERQRLIVGTGSTRPCHRQVQQQEYSTGPHDIPPNIDGRMRIW